MHLEQLSKSLVITLTVPALMLASTAFAADKERKMDTSKQMTQQERMATRAQATPSILKISEIMGITVENAQRDNLGEIKDVVVDPSDGSVAYAVLEAGGFLGIGEKYFAIPWRAFQTVADDDDKGDVERLILNVDNDRLKNAPGFDKDNWPDMADSEWGRTLHTYYDQQNYWEQRQAMRRDDRDKMNKLGAQNSATTNMKSGMSATVQKVEGDTVELQVPQGMVQDLQAGDRVEVSVQK
jgi:sporulation protein YlmC with PRC-barrel domain